MKEFGKWTVSSFRVGNGSKYFGVELGWNSSRLSLSGNFWTWEFMIIREWK